jgi:hypothetical protein
MLPGVLHIPRIGVEALDDVTVPGAQSGGQPPVAAANMNNQPILDARGVDYLRAV